MDTKLKKSRYSLGVKALMIVLCIASICTIAFTLPLVIDSNITTTLPSYENSAECNNELSAAQEWALRAFSEPTEAEREQIRDNLVSQLKHMRDEELAQIYRLGESDEAAMADGASWDDEMARPAIDAYEEGIASDETANDQSQREDDQSDVIEEYKADRIAEIKQKYEQEVQQTDERILKEHERDKQYAKNQLDAQKDILYAVYSINDLSTPLHTNIKDEMPLEFLFDRKATLSSIFVGNSSSSGQFEYGTLSGSNLRVFSESVNDYKNELSFEYDLATRDNALVVAVGMTDQAFLANDLAYRAEYKYYELNIIILFIALAVFILAFIWLMMSAGKTPTSDVVKIGWLDKIYLDIGFVLMLIANLLLFFLVVIIKIDVGIYEHPIQAAAFFAPIIIGVGLFLLWSMSLSRRIKDGSAAEHTLAYKIFGGLGQAYRESSAGARTVISLIITLFIGFLIVTMFIYGINTGDVFFLLFGLIATIIYLFVMLRMHLRKTAAVSKLSEGIERIKKGETEYQIPITDDAEVDTIADGVNNIAQGLSHAVQRKVNAERMKTELITNISHDLKTPLTSILTYVDLLKKEEGLSDTAKSHIDVLDMKGHRLKMLTDDLFEAAKAASGDMAVEIEKIDLIQLMEQALAELDDQIQASGLEFIVNVPADTPINVQADGNLLFRVLWNIIDNASRYSLAGSRIYLDVEKNNGDVQIVLKNTSQDKLNISEEELMERFVRADSSRNTDGSGLGLAIARNYTQLMGGQFTIEIDGDLFKVLLHLRQSE